VAPDVDEDGERATRFVAGCEVSPVGSVLAVLFIVVTAGVHCQGGLNDEMGEGPVCSVRDRWVAAHTNILVSELLYVLLVGNECFDVLSVLTHIEIMFVDASAAASMSAFVRG